MRILISGASGFIGEALTRYLIAEGHCLYLWRRKGEQQEAEIVSARGSVPTKLDALDAVVNLAGENIASGRWSKKRKQALRESRIGFTSKMLESLEARGLMPSCWINASAVGIYGNQPSVKINESSPLADDFAAQLCRDWELVAQGGGSKDTRVVHLRFGVVLGPGGALKRMLPAYNLGLGAIMGRGDQYMSWVALEDVLASIAFCLDRGELAGPINVVSPNAVTQRDFSLTLAQQLRRPLLFRFPESFLRFLFGEMSTLFTHDQAIYPERLISAGFEFRYPIISQALDAGRL